MSVEIESPENFIGQILNDLNSKRRATNIVIKEEDSFDSNKKSTSQIIKCEIPLANLLGYSNHIRSLTQGNANFNSTFSHFQDVEPDYIQL